MPLFKCFKLAEGLSLCVFNFDIVFTFDLESDVSKFWCSTT